MSNEDLEKLADEIAVKANECCNRSDGYEEEIRLVALKALESAAKPKILPNTLLCPWPDGYDPDKEYGRAIFRHLTNSNHSSDWDYRTAIRMVHEQASKYLPKGTQYEVGIAPLDLKDRVLVYWYSGPNIENIPPLQRAIPDHKIGPSDSETWKVVYGETWQFGRFYA
jgi:hypothetical protein